MNGKKAAIAALFLSICFSLFARDVTIIVEDTELALPLEGAVIRSWDGKEYVCGEDGASVVSVPDDRQVVIQAAYPGYENGRLVVTTGRSKFTLGLRLSGIMENRELVIEAARPGISETKTGRSVAVTEREIAQTAEIGIIEDVMSSIKLLPGVGYAGLFNAQPSIRGGDPGDMSASLDGFYVRSPYHWGGGFSIFDPRMVQSAQLSHGVFSTRYGHTISGLLEISSKDPSSTDIEAEISVNTSAANFNLSLPLAGKGGLLFMGRVTYYDPVVALAQQLAKSIEELEPINAIRVAPYIRSGTVTGNYRFFDNLELRATGFWGMDGIGVTYENSNNDNGLHSESNMDFDWINYKSFLTTGLSWNPRSDMLLKTTLGAGYALSNADALFLNIITKYFSRDFPTSSLPPSFTKNPYKFFTETPMKEKTADFNLQGRVDYDWEWGKGFLFAAGVQEMYSSYLDTTDVTFMQELSLKNIASGSELYQQIQQLVPKDVLDAVKDNNGSIVFPSDYSQSVKNNLFSTSAYILSEYTGKKFNVELGLRMDHFHLLGEDLSLSSLPAFNPRLNIDYTVFRNMGVFNSLAISAGTGLFSSMNEMVNIVHKDHGLDFLTPNRSWTSLLGSKLEFSGGLNLNIEGYYKYVYDRAYVQFEPTLEDGLNPRPYLDGEGRVWGIDLMLQKLQSRFWDGWVSYSFSHARYRNPHALTSGGNNNNDWYFPSYHRFHNLNLVLNVKPVPKVNIYTRFGFASGVQISKVVGGIESYPALVLDTKNNTMYFIEKYRRETVRDENNRTTPSLPMDIKVSILGENKNKKTRSEVYVAVENVLALVYSAQGNTSFNSYTGMEDTGSNSASYEMPIPIPSFGFRYSY